MIHLLLLLALSNPSVYEEAYRAHVRFLADDLLEGRETSKRGQKLAAAYLASQLASVGALGAFPESDTPFFQTFQLQQTTLADKTVSVWEGEEKVTLGGDQFELWSEGDGKPEAEGAMVFVGYGLDFDGYSDLDGVDLSGKWAVVLSGKPKLGDRVVPKRQQKDIPRYLKLLAKGALGLVILRDAPLDGQGTNEAEMSLPDRETDEFAVFVPAVSLPPSVHASVLGLHAGPLQEAVATLQEEGRPASFELSGRTFRLTARRNQQLVFTENVVAFLPGSDPKLKNEYVVLSAHYDHEGIRNGEIYNGADDNASGSATLLMAADYLRQLPRRRSTILLFLTAEEKGLLGSEYFVSRPVVPLEQIVADINVDMIGRSKDGRIGMIPSKVEGTTTLSKLATRVNKRGKHGIAFRDDMDRYHRRSDHFNFTAAGVPAIFFFTGTHEDYHQAGDDWQKLQYDQMARFFDFFKSFTMNVLNSKRRPSFTKIKS